MIFIHRGNETRIYRVSSGNKLDWVYDSNIYFDGDAEIILLSILMYFQIASTYIYNSYPKLKSIFGFLNQRQTMF